MDRFFVSYAIFVGFHLSYRSISRRMWKHWRPGCLLLMNFYNDLLCDSGWYSLGWCFWVPTKISGLPYPERTMGTEMSGSLIGLIKGCVQFGFTLKRVLRCQTSLSSRSVCVCECALKESLWRNMCVFVCALEGIVCICLYGCTQWRKNGMCVSTRAETLWMCVLMVEEELCFCVSVCLYPCGWS